MRNISRNLLIICSCLLTLVAIAVLVFIVVIQSTFTDKIVIRSNKEIHKIVEVADLKLIPTESKEYEIELNSYTSGDFKITLDYNELKDGGMKDFVDVKIIIEEKTIYEGKLTELFENNVSYNLRVESGYSSKILIIYSMAESVGSEAENTYADFEIDFGIKRANGEWW